MCNKVLCARGKQSIGSTVEVFELMLEKYEKTLRSHKRKNEKINVYNTFMTHFKQRYSKKITDEQAVYSDFLGSKNEAIQDICKLIEKKETVGKYVSNVKTVVIKPECNPVDKYKFISKVQIEQIGQEYIEEILRTVLKKGKVLDTESVTEKELKEFIKNYPLVRWRLLKRK